MKTLVLDIDGVLTNVFTDRLDEAFGPAQYPHEYDLRLSRPANVISIAGVLCDNFYYRSAVPINLAVYGVNSIRAHFNQRDIRIIACTARPEEVRGCTISFLTSINMPIDGLEHVEFKNKPAVIAKMNPDMVIDDAPHHVELLRHLGIKCMVFDQVWNKKVANPRLNGWEEWRRVCSAMEEGDRV